jgi:predicted alpha/beta superfamily hydrolase
MVRNLAKCQIVLSYYLLSQKFSKLLCWIYVVKFHKHSNNMNNISTLNKLMISITILLINVINLYGQETATLKELAIQSKILNQKRPIYVYLPAEYEERNLVSFDVIYVFDAQNREIFDLVHSSANFVFLKKKFIVVGVSSPAYEDVEYYRNSDYLPKPIKVSLQKYNTDKPNAENFSLYFMEEVIPFINKNYRTTNHNYLVGHSLSASFVLDKAINSPDLFKGFICISPNVAYDENRLADNFLKIDYNKPTENKFLFLSQADENKSFGKSWGEAFKKVKEFVGNSKNHGKYDIFIQEFPNFNHQATVLPAISESLILLSDFISKNPYTLNGETKEVIFKITVQNKNDEPYITGNQEGLGNWNPSKIKLNYVSDFEREIKLKVKFPIEFKITKGNWDSEVFTNQNTNMAENIIINKIETNTIHLKITQW